MAEADAVFTGQVVAIHKPGPYLRNGQMVTGSADLVKVEFKVGRVWKGPVRETLTVETERSKISCGFEFLEGRRYIVYTWRGSRTGLCTRTAPAWLAARDFAALGFGQRPGTPSDGVNEPGNDAAPRGSGCARQANAVGGGADGTALALLAGMALLSAGRWRRRR